MLSLIMAVRLKEDKLPDKCSICGATESKTFWDYPDGKVLCDKCEHKPKLLSNLKPLLKYSVPLLIIVIVVAISMLLFTYAENSSLKQDIVGLQNEKSDLNSRIASLNETLDTCQEANLTFNNQYETVSNELDSTKKEYSGAYKVPYVVMRGRTATTVFKKINGELITWKWPASAFEDAFTTSYKKKTLIPATFVPMMQSICDNYNNTLYNTYKAYFSLCEYLCVNLNACSCRPTVQSYYDSYVSETNTCTQRVQSIADQGVHYKELTLPNGTKTRVIDYTEFVEKDVFKNVINTIYDPNKTDRENLEEIANVNSQLTTYSSLLGGVPRYSLETLSEGGGDCGAKAVLVASLLKAVPKNWKVQLVYLDSDNPANPQNVNHALVYVDTGTYKTFIETTTDSNELDYWTQELNGWYFDV
jgi:hypothetical protein